MLPLQNEHDRATNPENMTKMDIASLSVAYVHNNAGKIRKYYDSDK